MKARLTLISKPDKIKHLPDGKVMLVFEQEVEEENEDIKDDPDASGDYQSDMVWDVFSDREFEVVD